MALEKGGGNAAREQERHHLRRRRVHRRRGRQEFSREGARVFLAGRTREPLEAVAGDIRSAGGLAEVSVLDALDERAVDEHARDVVSQAGSIDVSFNLITRGDVQGIPLVEMATEDLLRAVVNGLRTNFITRGRRRAAWSSRAPGSSWR